MNREIGCVLIDEELGRLRNLSYAELLNLLDKPSTVNVQGPDGKRYQIERQAFWDSKKGGNIRVERLIKARIPDAEVTIRDLAGDGDHYAATVVAESFRGKSRVQQHQIVYEALKAEMGGKLHALALQTSIPGG